jgi:hypothetical protein
MKFDALGQIAGSVLIWFGTLAVVACLCMQSVTVPAACQNKTVPIFPEFKFGTPSRFVDGLLWRTQQVAIYDISKNNYISFASPDFFEIPRVEALQPENIPVKTDDSPRFVREHYFSFLEINLLIDGNFWNFGSLRNDQEILRRRDDRSWSSTTVLGFYLESIGHRLCLAHGSLRHDHAHRPRPGRDAGSIRRVRT